jgi:hypothetical protein
MEVVLSGAHPAWSLASARPVVEPERPDVAQLALEENYWVLIIVATQHNVIIQ